MIFPILWCPQCRRMLPVPSFSFHHSKEKIQPIIFIHSKAGTQIIMTIWRELWDLDIAQTGNYNFLTHVGTETEVFPFIKGEEKLITVLRAGKVTILFNVSKILFCTALNMQAGVNILEKLLIVL